MVGDQITCKVEIYNNRLLDCNNKFKDILVSEHSVWKEYEEALHDVCDKIVVGKHGGSGAPLAYGEFFIESYEQRLISLLDYYFHLIRIYNILYLDLNL